MTTASSGQPGAPHVTRGGPLALVASTDLAGFALQNATPVILTWQTPNDDQMHRAIVFFLLEVSVLEVGGATGVNFTNPAGLAHNNFQILGGAQAIGPHVWGFAEFLLAPNTTFQVVQTSALTGGAAVAFAEIWGS